MRYSLMDLYMAFLYNYLNQLRLFTLNAKELRSTWSGVLQYALTRLSNSPGLICEFGVYQGRSINLIADKLPEEIIYGFDSFEGFPKDGRSDWSQDFSTPMPEVKNNVRLIKGYFDQTLPEFFQTTDDKIKFLHIDCDIYSSTHTIFSLSRQYDKIGTNTILVFDELINYKTAIWNELLALFRYLFICNKSIRWLCCHKYVENVNECLYQIRKGTYPNNPMERGDRWRSQAACRIDANPIQYFDFDNPDYSDKIKFMTGKFHKYSLEFKMNSVNDEDFQEIYTLRDNYPVIY